MPGFCTAVVVWTVSIPSLDVCELQEQCLEERQNTGGGINARELSQL